MMKMQNSCLSYKWKTKEARPYMFIFSIWIPVGEYDKFSKVVMKLFILGMIARDL
jgi:hypothetical protein